MRASYRCRRQRAISSVPPVQALLQDTIQRVLSFTRWSLAAPVSLPASASYAAAIVRSALASSGRPQIVFSMAFEAFEQSKLGPVCAQAGAATVKANNAAIAILISP